VSIYTKTGDAGTTALLGGTRVSKDDTRVDAYGTVDETNALIGVARAADPPAEVARTLKNVQQDLFAIGAELASGPAELEALRPKLVSAEDVRRLEQAIDALEQQLPTQTGFILPAGCSAAAALHQARTVCRRAERRTVAAGRHVAIRAELLVYLNRLGDLLHLLARRCNQAAGVPEDG
jgi:cob(I)alamin adenosyltransferase